MNRLDLKAGISSPLVFYEWTRNITSACIAAYVLAEKQFVNLSSIFSSSF